MIGLIRQIVTLSKVRIIVLLVFTAMCGMWKVTEGFPGTSLLLAVVIGGGLAAAGSNAINQGLEFDIDGAMSRTRNRPIPTNRIGSRTAVFTGIALIIVGILLIGFVANWASALLTVLAAGVYVFVYTLILKRHSWNNIVIGGAAGAFPPLIGAVAVTGSVDVVGIYMFALVFFWTPPHFWTLSIMLKEDYATAKIPMLASVTSTGQTVAQIILYIALLLIMSWIPVAAGYGGFGFPIVTTIMSAQWIGRSIRLLRDPSYRTALDSYKFSLLYLAVVFLAFAIEPLLPGY